jgi:hypothetical protein
MNRHKGAKLRRMDRVASRRLIDASASLGPADRALLNLWVNRGLDDAAVARMTGMEPAAIAERRGRMVARLSEELGLPPGDIADALGTLAASPGQPPDEGPVPGIAGSDNGGPGEAEAGAAGTRLNGSAPSAESVGAPSAAPETADASPVETPAPETADASPVETPAPDTADTSPVETPAPETADASPVETPAPETADAPPAVDAPRSRRRLWAWVPLLLAAVVGLVVVLLVTAGGPAKHRRTVTAAHTPTVPAVPVTPTVPSPSPPVSRPQGNPLAALPGGFSHARGSLLVSGGPKQLKLRLTVSGLPAAHDGHYEVWLYNTLVDSQRLARLRTGVGHLVISLPGRSAHFRWIDISFQPAGLIYHSGESVLRTLNPARLGRRRLRPSAGRRQLRRATSGSKRASKSK